MSTWRPVSRPPRWLGWLPAWILAPLRWALRLALLAVLAFAAVAFFYLVQASRFDLDEVAAMPARTIILDREGREIEAGWGTSRRLSRREDLPDFLVKALLAREDAKFLDHPGIDLRGLARATLRNLKDREFTQGASTLTMQLARNTFEMRAKSIHRKLLEIALTLRIERAYSKDEILTHYLNRIYFGAGCHGIDEAARSYFGKPVAELRPAESAMLVGIIRGPHVFSPFRNLAGAEREQRDVLDRMIATGDLDAAGKQDILARPVKLVPEDQRGVERSYALLAVRRELEGILDTLDIRIDGLVVHTALDPGWQMRLETELSEALLRAEGQSGWEHPTHARHESGPTPGYLQCAAVTLESDSGEVLAWIGGRDVLDSRFDRSTGARRDLGTAFKPFIAAAASERGKRVLAGHPLLTGRQIGPQETARIAKRCGLGGPFLETEDLFRGSAATTPLEAATALATLASGGQRPQPRLITRVSDAAGKTLYEARPAPSRALHASAAGEALDLFETSGAVRILTGHTGSERDAWLLRVGPQGSTAIWIGFDTPQRIASESRLAALLADLAAHLTD